MACMSHPNKRLIDHLECVQKIGLEVFDSKRGIRFFESVENIRKTLDFVLFYHDIGKATVYFQEHLKSSIEQRTCKYDNKLTQHSLLSACITAYKTYKGVQSEHKKLLSLIGFLAVRKHHGDFENLDEMISVKKKIWKTLKDQFDSICSEFKVYTSDVDFDEMKDLVNGFPFFDIPKTLDSYVLLNFIFSILTYSDKTEVILGEAPKYKKLREKLGIVDIYKKKVFQGKSNDTINSIRDDIYIMSELYLNTTYQKSRIFSLNVPTGGGKTLSVLNVTLKMLGKDEQLERIIYALPFTSIVDQTETIIRDIFDKNRLDPKDYLTVHHHLTDEKINQDENATKLDVAQFLIENWEKPLILTTFWQLFYTLINAKNSRMRKLHNISNSVIILDEVQNIPYKYWHITNKLLKQVAENLNCRIILLTATMPMLFDENKGEIISLIPNNRKEEYFKAFSRYKVEFDKTDKTITDVLDSGLKEIGKNPKKDFLFVFNTIASSVEFFKQIKKEVKNRELIYLSANILPIDRKTRIERIKLIKQPKIVISTQLIEAGVDIDFDVVYRDFSPLDSIVQTAGRCNRNNKRQMGFVKVFKLRNKKSSYDFSYIYKGLSLHKTERVLSSNTCFFEKDLKKIVDNYYEIINQDSSNNESIYLEQNLRELEYVELEENFKLIDEIPSFLIFFEYDENAGELLKRFERISLIEDRFERKSEFLTIKSDFYKYALSAKLSEKTKSYYTALKDIKGVRIVGRDVLGSIYNKDTGLVVTEGDNFV